jgi:hypothetical protein
MQKSVLSKREKLEDREFLVNLKKAFPAEVRKKDHGTNFTKYWMSVMHLWPGLRSAIGSLKDSR